MKPEQFREFITQDLAAIARRHPTYPNDGIRFTHWVLENVFLLSDSDARTANYDGPNDGGLDSLFVDSHEDTVRLVEPALFARAQEPVSSYRDYSPESS